MWGDREPSPVALNSHSCVMGVKKDRADGIIHLLGPDFKQYYLSARDRFRFCVNPKNWYKI